MTRTDKWAAVMHLNAENGQDNEALRSLAVVLLTLAAIAESVARRSAPVRCLLLWLLCRAEARVFDFACRTGAGAAMALPSTGSPVCWLGGFGQGVRLAQRFRALAAIFFALARQAPQWLRTARRNDLVCLSANCRALVRPGLWSGLRDRSFTDTS
jgi:hypothetical protein